MAWGNSYIQGTQVLADVHLFYLLWISDIIYNFTHQDFTRIFFTDPPSRVSWTIYKDAPSWKNLRKSLSTNNVKKNIYTCGRHGWITKQRMTLYKTFLFRFSVSKCSVMEVSWEEAAWNKVITLNTIKYRSFSLFYFPGWHTFVQEAKLCEKSTFR